MNAGNRLALDKIMVAKKCMDELALPGGFGTEADEWIKENKFSFLNGDYLILPLAYKGEILKAMEITEKELPDNVKFSDMIEKDNFFLMKNKSNYDLFESIYSEK